MNREIKFRAWDKEDSKMYKVVSISESIWGHEEDKHLLICDFDKNPMNQKTDVRISVNYELMQFTGLHDKNGVEIYEGDILEWDNEIGSVVFDNCAFQLDCPKYKFGYIDLGKVIIYGDQECKPLIIGNIYENENLLKQKDGN